MTLTSNHKLKLIRFLVTLLVLFWLPVGATAQGLELSVTPTLFEMTAVPGQVWKSQVKAINSNSFPITVYAEVMNFAPEGEGGQGKFVPVFADFTEGTTVAEWIELSGESIEIPPEESRQIPFTVTVPADASPGGHFAAILVGTQPPESSGMQVTTSQVVTSLFFARIAGDVIEEGSIREFRTTERFVAEPRADFEVRFENKGNVHIQPQGQIEIFNMWGKERGVIPINRTTHFGNVLPDSIRKFEFSWRGEQTISDIGRYKAVLTLGYGLDARQFVTSTTYFYVVPIKALATVLGGLLFAFFFISWAIRAYVRRMLALSGVDVSYDARRQHKHTFLREGDVLIEKRSPKINAPISSGLTDLKDRLAQTHAFVDTSKALWQFVVQYRLFFISLIVFVIIFTLLFLFVREVGQDQKRYEVTIDNADQAVTLSSEEIIYEQTQRADTDATAAVTNVANISTTTASSSYQLQIINASDIAGAAANLKVSLETDGYLVASIGSDLAQSRDRTVVVYAPGLEDEALALSQQLGNALLSADAEAEATIVIYVGNDFTDLQ